MKNQLITFCCSIAKTRFLWQSLLSLFGVTFVLSAIVRKTERLFWDDMDPSFLGQFEKRGIKGVNPFFEEPFLGRYFFLRGGGVRPGGEVVELYINEYSMSLINFVY